ncbi:MAG TPA: hypothetical protein VMH28_25810 [Candidatus Acidoferrales bacterium]|nr:hypothetical protein [Candidatus Acidoferrales bacterium]
MTPRALALPATVAACLTLFGCGAAGVWVPYPKAPRNPPALDTIHPGTTTRDEILQLIPNAIHHVDTPRFLWAEWEEAYAGYVAAQYPAAPDTGKRAERGDYARAVHLAAVFDEHGIVQQHCRAHWGGLDECLAALARSAPPPDRVALPIDLITTDFLEDWPLRVNFYGRVTIADNRICLLTERDTAHPIRVLPVSTLRGVDVSHLRLLLQHEGSRIKTAEAKSSPDQTWRLMWLLYSGKAPPSEPAIPRGPDPEAVRNGVTTRAGLVHLAGQFDTAADPSGALFWARWKQRKPRFGTTSSEPYWEIVNLLATFDERQVVAQSIFCRDLELFDRLRSLKSAVPAASLPAPPFHLRFINIHGFAWSYGRFDFTLYPDRLLLTEDKKTWQLSAAAFEGATPTPLSTVEKIRWRLHVNNGDKVLASSPQELTPAQTWHLAVAR